MSVLLLMHNANAQTHYKACTEYTVFAGRPNDTVATKQQFFNKYGKIIKELYYADKNADKPDSPADMFLDKTTTYGYVNDTVLYFERTIAENGRPHVDDTTVSFYSYDDKSRLKEVLSASYGYGGQGCLIDPNYRRWYDSTRTAYKYDEQNRVEEVATIDIGINMPTGFVIGIQPNFKKYVYNTEGRVARVENLKIYSLKDIDFSYPKKNGQTDTICVSREDFQYHDKHYEIIWKGVDGITPKMETSIYFYDSSGNIIHECINKEELNEYYEGPVERIYGLYPDKRLKTQVDYNALGNVTKTHNYFYN